MTTDTGVTPPAAEPAPDLPEFAGPPVRSRNRRGIWIGVVAGMLAVLVAAGAALWITDPLGMTGGTELTATFRRVDPTERHRANVQAMLDARAEALLAGDEAGWMAAVDTGGKDLVTEQRRTFRVLRKMGVSFYSYELVGTRGLPGDGRQMTASVNVRYCFGAKTCRPPGSEAVLWLGGTGDRLTITRYKPEVDVRPWEVSDLRVATGDRVVVAAPPRYADRLARFRREADRAAVYANRFGPKDGTLGKHLVFLGVPGGSADRWYGDGLAETDNGFVHELSAADASRVAVVEHVIRADKVSDADVRFLMSWHLGYGAAATGAEEPSGRYWWMFVGIGHYLGHSRESPALYEIEEDLRQVLKTWDGTLSDLYPQDSGEGWQTAAWVAVHRLIDRYGEKEFTAFLDAVARNGVDYDDAATRHFGRGIGKIQADVLDYMRGLT